MAITGASGSDSPDVQAPLLYDTVEGCVDYKGRPVYKSNSGGWRSASFIIGVEVAERFAFYGISSNLITYLTGPLGQSTATAAENVNAWSGTASLLPLLGAFVADSFLGRFRTIVVASLTYILGLGLLTLSAMLPSFSASDCPSINIITSCSANPIQWHPTNTTSLNYIQDNLNWALGFGIPCIMMVIALILFLLGTKTYRYSVKVEEKSAFLRIGKVFVAAIKNWRTSSSAIALEEEARGMLPHQRSEQFKFLNKALLAPNGSKESGKVCSLTEVEEAKAVLRLVPIWATCLVYAVVALTGKPSGITMLQRIGTGMFLSVLSMAIAALIEIKRLEVAREYGLIDKPNVTVPMSIWWLVPQYVMFGLADVFTMVGLQEFFYDQVPSELRSVGLSLYLSIFGVGSFISSFLVSAIEKATGGEGHDSWFANNLNRGHLDYFYWLLAALSIVQSVAYLYFAKNYVYNR
ncbi:hypothetical protein GH714_021390 [Hevea brasiliensis]|uniref:Major facilitator superfamily (MFS) profile domain-containing protein n=1 Tax=Hevea brasiliensis TaxID=3981 RepID=A0A6A6L7A4_HEVBR|nr:hypothetical protein GH714_021390 [Hevea brasiliensis]